MQGSKVKRLIYNKDTVERLEELKSKWKPYEKKRAKLLKQNKSLIDKVKRERVHTIKNLDEIAFATLKNFQQSGIDTFIAKNRLEAVNFMREIIEEKGVVIVPSTQTTEVGVTQAFSLSNEFVIFSLDHMMCVECGIPPMHPLFTVWEKSKRVDPKKVEKDMKEKARKADVLILSALCISKDGSIFLDKKERDALNFMKKNVKDIFIIVGVDRIANSDDYCSNLAKLMSISTGELIKPDKIKTDKIKHKLHIIFMDNGRLALSRTASRNVLTCIHCYTCSLYCPIYWLIGYTYGPPEMSGIGVIKISFKEGIKRSVDRGLYYCILCARCVEECPIGVDITGEHKKLRRKVKISNL